MRRTVIVLSLCAVVLCGCGPTVEKEQPVVEEQPALAELSDSCDMFGTTFQSIGPMCGYVTSDDTVSIYPYYKSPEHIDVKRMLLSDRGFWDTVKANETDAVVAESDKYFTITLTTGTTYGVILAESDSVILIKTDSLPSAYVKVVCEKLCQSNT